MNPRPPELLDPAAQEALPPQLLDPVAEGALALCELTTWCWPAHDEVRERRGWMLPDVDAPVLDLGAGEVAAQLAWLDAVLGPDLDLRWPGLRERMRREVDQRVLTPFLDRQDWHWLGLGGDVDNWNPWIHGNVITAALQFLAPGDPRRRAAVTRSVEGIDRFLAALPPDGAIDEGWGYWWNGACRALEALDLLRHATGGRLDFRDVPVLRATTGFPQGCYLGNGWFIGVADAPVRTTDESPWAALARVARWLGNTDAAAFALSQRDLPDAADPPPLARERAGLGRYLLALIDPEWSAAPAGPAVVTSSWWPSIQLRHVAADAPHRLGLSVKGGHNGEHHNHLDVGQVIVDVEGSPAVVDPGRGEYTAQTFGPQRYLAWHLGSEWHSVPAIAGVSQGVGPEFRATDVTVLDGPAGRGVELELIDAYPGVAGSWRRRALTLPDGSIAITDSWALAPGAAPDAEQDRPRPSRIHYVLAGTAGPVRGDSLALWSLGAPGAGASEPVILRWESSALVTARVEQRELTDPFHRRAWGAVLTRLTLEVADPAGRLTLHVSHAPQATIANPDLGAQ